LLSGYSQGSKGPVNGPGHTYQDVGGDDGRTIKLENGGFLIAGETIEPQKVHLPEKRSNRYGLT